MRQNGLKEYYVYTDTINFGQIKCEKANANESIQQNDCKDALSLDQANSLKTIDTSAKMISIKVSDMIYVASTISISILTYVEHVVCHFYTVGSC